MQATTALNPLPTTITTSIHHLSIINMELQSVSPEEALCHCLSNNDNVEHIKQFHFHLPSLPSPEKPISLPTSHIAIRSETSVFRPRQIANLWTQLLSIHIQNGHFWRHDHAVSLHQEKVRANTPPRDVGDQAYESLQKGVMYLRFKIQKALLSRDQQPSEADLPRIAEFFSKIESFGDLDVNTLRYTKIHKVLKAILKLEYIVGDESYHFKSRCTVLFEMYQRTLDSAQQSNFTTVISPSATTEDYGEPIDTPALCLTQLSEQQCKQIEEAAAKCDPPLDRGVVELMCILPQLTSKYGTYDLQVIPMGRMVQTIDSFPKLDRGVYSGGPIIPPHVAKLTFWVAPGYESAYFIDTKTCESIQLHEFSPEDPGALCTRFKGPRRPIEELLQEWIDAFLSLKMAPSGREGFMAEGSRSNWSMDYLKQKMLLLEHGWPSSFPLSQPDYQSLIKAQSDIYKDSMARREISLNHKWVEFTARWREINRPRGYIPGTKREEIEREQALDQRIKEGFQYHIEKLENRRYALAADVPLDPRLRDPLILRPSGHSGEDWSVDLTPPMLMERFNDVLRANEDASEGQEMKEILEKAFERWEMTEKGIHLRDYVDEEDDDSSSDYVVLEEGEGGDEEDWEGDESEDGEWEVDEEDEELEFDVVMLEADDKIDVEEIRERLKDYNIR